MDSLLCLSISHQTAPLELREKINLPADQIATILDDFVSGRAGYLAQFSELAFLSTCNRTELYARGTGVEKREGDLPSIQALLDLLLNLGTLSKDEIARHYQDYHGQAAAEHLMRVAAGLDSMILGEPQILGQVSDAFELAHEHGSAGPTLNELFRFALRAGKRARAETSIARNPASAGSVGVNLAENVLGNLKDKSILVIGAGEMAELVVTALQSRSARHITIVNRTRQRSAALAMRAGYETARYDQLADVIRKADLVVSAAHAPHPLINYDLIQETLASRAGQPIVLLDIGVPRNVDPQVKELPGVYLFDLDDLHTRLDGSIAAREAQIPAVEGIISEELAAYEARVHKTGIDNLIVALHKSAEEIRLRELEKTLHQLPDIDEETQQRIQALTRSLVDKILHEPTLRLRSEDLDGRAADYSEAIRYLFGLTETASPIE
jgi:glutamyl-tRNA reductase